MQRQAVVVRAAVRHAQHGAVQAAECGVGACCGFLVEVTRQADGL
mgnify:CR=1 FL=1